MRSVPAFLLVCALLLSACMEDEPFTPAETAAASLPPNTYNTRTVAAEGDTVWVLINPVKADKRQQFEQFIHESLWDEADRLSPELQQAVRQTRVLHPTGPNENGAYDYIFIMDPHITGQDYGIENALAMMYEEQEAAEHLKLFVDALAGEQELYIMVQSRH